MFCSFFSCSYNILLHFPLFFCFLPALNQSFLGQTGLFPTTTTSSSSMSYSIIQLLSFSPTKNVRISVGTEPNSAGVSPSRPTNDDFVLVFISLPSEAPQKQQRTIGGKGDTFKHVGTETVFPQKIKLREQTPFPEKCFTDSKIYFFACSNFFLYFKYLEIPHDFPK